MFITRSSSLLTLAILLLSIFSHIENKCFAEDKGFFTNKKDALIQDKDCVIKNGEAHITFTVKIKSDRLGTKWVAVGGWTKSGKKYITGSITGKKYFACKIFEAETGDVLKVTVVSPAPFDWEKYDYKIEVVQYAVLALNTNADTIDDVIPTEVGDK